MQNWLTNSRPGSTLAEKNGEFHTFVYDGPMFVHAIPVQNGETVTRDGFVFTDLLRERTGGSSRGLSRVIMIP